MRKLIKGENIYLSELGTASAPVTVVLGGQGIAQASDVGVLVLRHGTGRESPQDLLWDDQSSTSDGSVRLIGGSPSGGPRALRASIDLSAIPAEFTNVLVAASRLREFIFGDLPPLRIAVLDGVDRPVLEFDIADASTEKAMALVEFYRSADTWKLRAVGQGYSSVSGLAADRSISMGAVLNEQSRGPAPLTPAQLAQYRERLANKLDGAQQSAFRDRDPVAYELWLDGQLAHVPMPTEQKPDINGWREGDRVKLVRPFNGDELTFPTGRTGILLVTDTAPAQIDLARDGIYEVFIEGADGGLIGVTGEYLERTEGRVRVEYAGRRVTFSAPQY
ncbi:TerD family protein [Microbispora siamensis]